MKFSIRHETEYTYSRPVFLDPHTIRLYPRGGMGTRVVKHRLDLEPDPAGRSVVQDLDGNLAHHVWFSNLTDKLIITTETEVETFTYDAFNFLVDPPDNARLPVKYSSEVQPLIAAYLGRCSTNVPTTHFATSIAQEVGYETVPFLALLAQRIHGLFERVDRPAGAPLPPQQTLKELRGSCRDLAVVFIDSCRAVGLASRFVSGYVLDERNDDSRELHAWAEVCLPGAGWRGFDPSQGLAVGNRHLPVASGRVSALASPVSGVFRGTGIKSTLSHKIVIEQHAGVEV